MKAGVQAVSSAFQAFADPTRLRILNLLRGGELCVCDVCATLELSQPKVSRHLAILRSAGLVEARREGKWMHYRIASVDDALCRSLIDCVGTCLQSVDEFRSDRKRLRAACSACR